MPGFPLSSGQNISKASPRTGQLTLALPMELNRSVLGLRQRNWS
jgi:hypothetical protein